MCVDPSGGYQSRSLRFNHIYKSLFQILRANDDYSFYQRIVRIVADWSFPEWDQSALEYVMADGQFYFPPDVVQILIYLIAKIHRRIINAGLIANVITPLSDQNIKACIEGIAFAARMAFDSTETVDIVNHNSHWMQMRSAA